MRRSLNALRLITAVALVATIGSCALFVGRAPEAVDRPAYTPPVMDAPDRDSADRPDDGSDAVAIVPGDRTEPATTQPPPVDPDWRVLDAGTNSAVRIPVARAVHDASVWTEVWAAIHANMIDPPALPTVNFARETVIVLLLGERRTGGYSVRVDGWRTTSSNRSPAVEVTIHVTAPAAGDMVTQALTSPYELSAIPIASAAVTFVGDDVERGFEGD